MVGRYLIYRGKGPEILYRYDSDKNELREFVYVPTRSSLKKDGEVIRWRFEGVNLSLKDNGSVRLIHSRNPSEKLSQIADNGLQTRISKFLEKRNQPLSKALIEKTLFVIPRPEFVDGNFKTLTKGIRYEVSNTELKLMLNPEMGFRFPLGVDPTLRADTGADVILNGQSDSDYFGFSVASAGDFNGDGIDEVIIGAKEDQDTDKLKDVVFHTYIPNIIIVGRHNPDNGITSPLLDGKEQQNDKPTAYVCENYTCLNPTNEPQTLLAQLSDE